MYSMVIQRVTLWPRFDAAGKVILPTAISDGTYQKGGEFSDSSRSHYLSEPYLALLGDSALKAYKQNF